MTKLLTRDAILGASDIKSEEVRVPEWGGTVRVRGLTAAQRDQVEAQAVSRRGNNVDINMANIRARIVAFTIVGDDDKPIFTNADVKALGEKSARALDRVFEVATRLSGMGESDIEDLAKNSDAETSDDSPSD